MHRKESQVSRNLKVFRLKINRKKTDFMYQTSPGSYNIGQDTQNKGQVLTKVIKFKYQGSVVANNNRLNPELDIEISNVS